MPTPAGTWRSVAKRGQTAILRRPGTPDVDATIKAFIRQGTPEQLEDDRHVAEKACTIAALDPGLASWPLPPRAGDFVVVGGTRYLVVGVEPRRVGDTDCRWDMTIRGPA